MSPAKLDFSLPALILTDHGLPLACIPDRRFGFALTDGQLIWPRGSGLNGGFRKAEANELPKWAVDQLRPVLAQYDH